ncbi:MAG TPA: tagaturonate epimerase family protein [Eubacteriales bacterium]|nr:tagaturonate epimerase family protein [Eubacteriales bacterium]
MDIYKNSVHSAGNTTVSVARGSKADVLVVRGENPGFSGQVIDGEFIAPENHENAVVLRRVFPFTAPVPVLTRKRSFGVGDRLGIASYGHIRVFRKYDAAPVLAQQSIRELTLTHRDFDNVLDCASYAVFREDWQGGFGADGDHLKTDKEVEYALSCGYTMITLDCSEHIRNDVEDMPTEQLKKEYTPNAELEARYKDKSFKVENHEIHFTAEELMRCALIYGGAIEHADRIFHSYIKGKPVDFELSIDETATPTTPTQHFFVANELSLRHVELATVAPRFCGEFQKGIDYIGDLKQFESEMAVHAAVARRFGYKLSIHSGSDKLSVFPIIGRLTLGNFHVKTAGTNWLEAMRVTAETDPKLYREVHAYALVAFHEAKKYYHVTTNLNNIPALDTLTDAQLPELFTQNDARQLIHITYGLILSAKDENGNSLYRDRLYANWREHDELYAKRLEQHIGRHLELLYSQIPQD